ncbi:MAG TPA: DUF2087 domain-containing protein [Clostridiales bacterium]|nr:DUF2087 domain-containing protein [Clostridiales bacterium]
MTLTYELRNFLDGEGRLKIYPAKQKYKILSLFYLASKFKAGRIYTEKEVNLILNQWHTFGDWAMLRRELYDKGFLCRKPDCTAYWLEEKQPTISSFGL